MSAQGPLEGHLDDEAISGLLDGEAEPGAAGHLDSCPACAARRDRFAAVAAALAATGLREAPAAYDLARERAVRAALAAAVPVPQGARRRPAGRRWLGAAAAAVVVAAGLAAGLSVTSGSNHHASTAIGKSPPLTGSLSEGAGVAAGPGLAEPANADLGDIQTPTQLRQVLAARLGSGLSDGAGASGSGGASAGSGGGAAGAPVAGGTSGSAGAGGSVAGGSGTSAASPGQAAPAGGAAAPVPTPQSPSCGTASAGPEIYRAYARYSGVPAVVVVHAIGQGRHADVLALAGCRVLASIDF